MYIYIYIYIYRYRYKYFVDKAFLSSYADATALYSVQKKHILNKFILKKNVMYLQKWFHDNYMVLNPGKFYHRLLV